MRVMLVDDDPRSRVETAYLIRQLGHEPVEVASGAEAVETFDQAGCRIVILDWTMPGLDGLEVCRRLRAVTSRAYTYIILLTGKPPLPANQNEALEAGVDDFLAKPAKFQEVRMRLHVAERILGYTATIRQLASFLPICSYCKRVRDDEDYWRQIEDYLRTHAGTEFSHSVCPDCFEHHVQPELKRLGRPPC